MRRIIATLCMMGLVSSSAVDEESNYCAQIVGTEAGGAVGYFAMQIFEGTATYSYQLDLSSFTTTCKLDDGLKYHIHSFWTGSESNSASGPDKCGPAVTGGHYDPNLACGYVSNDCKALNRTVADYSCTPSKYKEGRHESCQIGDLSGKFDLAKGPLVFSQSSLLRDYQPPYPSNFLSENKFKNMWSSIVFHCSDDVRLVCAKFKLVTDTAQSACPFPPSSSSVIQGLEKKVKRGNTNLVVLGVAMFTFFIIYTIVIALVWWRQYNIRKKLADSDFITL